MKSNPDQLDLFGKPPWGRQTNMVRIIGDPIPSVGKKHPVPAIGDVRAITWAHEAIAEVYCEGWPVYYAWSALSPTGLNILGEKIDASYT